MYVCRPEAKIKQSFAASCRFLGGRGEGKSAENQALLD